MLIIGVAGYIWRSVRYSCFTELHITLIHVPPRTSRSSSTYKSYEAQQSVNRTFVMLIDQGCGAMAMGSPELRGSHQNDIRPYTVCVNGKQIATAHL